MQVVYNVFDQAPEDELFPACERLKIGVIARVPFDEGSLTGTLTPDSRWPEGDFRNAYFSADNLAATLPRVDAVRRLVARGMALPELALRFILQHPAVATTIPGHAQVGPRRAEPRRLRRTAPVGPAGRGLREQRWDRTRDLE